MDLLVGAEELGGVLGGDALACVGDGEVEDVVARRDDGVRGRGVDPHRQHHGPRGGELEGVGGRGPKGGAGREGGGGGKAGGGGRKAPAPWRDMRLTMICFSQCGSPIISMSCGDGGNVRIPGHTHWRIRTRRTQSASKFCSRVAVSRFWVAF